MTKSVISNQNFHTATMDNKLLTLFARSGRKAGLTLQMAISAKKSLDKGEPVFVGPAHYPTVLVRILGNLGVQVEVEPCYTQPPFEIHYDTWGEPTGEITWPEKKLTGYKIKSTNDGLLSPTPQ